MNNLNVNRKIVVVCVLLIIIFSFLLYYTKTENKVINEENDNYRNYTRIEKYEANQYIPVYMTESDVVKKYFNDYKNNVIYNPTEAYNMLNKDYREKRFGNYDSYKEYLDENMSSALYSMEVAMYSVTIINNKKFFNVYDKSDFQYIIKENSIMDYEIYLDENTVEIK